MSEQYKDNDTNEITLPQGRERPSHRETFIAPIVHSRFSGEAPMAQTSMFDLVDPTNPRSPRYAQSLMRGDEIKVPVSAYDDDDQQIPNTVRMLKYTVTSVDTSGDKPVAQLESDAGIIEDSISADAIVNGARLESAIAQRLIEQDGIDLHNPNLTILDDTEKKG